MSGLVKVVYHVFYGNFFAEFLRFFYIVTFILVDYISFVMI